MKPAMYIFLNKGLGMSTGKSAAQASHAAVEAAILSAPYSPEGEWVPDDKKKALWNAWREGLHYAKYVMEARDAHHLETIERYLNDRGFRTVLIIDEGHTEVPPLTVTALGVALVDKDDPHTKAAFSSFKLYRNEKPQEPTNAISGGFRNVAMWGYPLALSLYYGGGDTINVTDALVESGGSFRVDPDKVLNSVGKFEKEEPRRRTRIWGDSLVPMPNVLDRGELREPLNLDSAREERHSRRLP